MRRAATFPNRKRPDLKIWSPEKKRNMMNATTDMQAPNASITTGAEPSST